MKVWVACWEHRHGSELRAFHTFGGVAEWRQEIACDNWDMEIDKDEIKPDDPEEMADAYFEHMQMELVHFECFHYDEVEVL